MYNRNVKDEYRKKIEELIGGRQRSNSGGDVINIIDDDDDTNKDINMSSCDTNSNTIRITRWTPVATKIEGIRKYLEANKININN